MIRAHIYTQWSASVHYEPSWIARLVGRRAYDREAHWTGREWCWLSDNRPVRGGELAAIEREQKRIADEQRLDALSKY